MTYNSRPTYGIKQSFYGPAAWAEAQYQQAVNPQSAQSLAVGNSEKNIIEGFEKPVYPQSGTKQELMGAGIVPLAQAVQEYAEAAQQEEEEEKEPKKDDAVEENN